MTSINNLKKNNYMVTWKQIVEWVKGKLNSIARNEVNKQNVKKIITDAKVANMKPVSTLWTVWQAVYDAAGKTGNAIKKLTNKIKK